MSTGQFDVDPLPVRPLLRPAQSLDRATIEGLRRLEPRRAAAGGWFGERTTLAPMDTFMIIVRVGLALTIVAVAVIAYRLRRVYRDRL